MQTKYFECVCSCYLHNIRLVWFQDDWMKEHNEEKELYIDIMLNHYQPFWKRIWIAIQYIFKKESCRPYDCVTLSYDEAIKLKDFIGELNNEDSN